MKLLYTIFISCLFFSCQKERNVLPLEENPTTEKSYDAVAHGKEIFEGKGMCVTCHREKETHTGPSILDITKIYKTKKASITLFLLGELEPIVDPSQYEIMQANIEITKTMTPEELSALEAYMYSIK
jgi:cytochrome c